MPVAIIFVYWKFDTQKSAILDQCQQLATLYSNIQKLKWSDWNIDIQFYNTQNGFGPEKRYYENKRTELSGQF